MPSYKKMYYCLFNKITDVIAQLQEIQQMTEEIYINEGEPNIVLAESEREKK